MEPPEVILQKSFAEELLGITPKPGTDNTNLADLAKPLLGKELTMRYAERASSSSSSSSPSSSGEGRSDRCRVFRGLTRASLKIVGLTDLDPDSMRGGARARVFLPLKLAENLHIMQPNLRDTSASDCAQLYLTQRAGGEP